MEIQSRNGLENLFETRTWALAPPGPGHIYVPSDVGAVSLRTEGPQEAGAVLRPGQSLTPVMPPREGNPVAAWAPLVSQVVFAPDGSAFVRFSRINIGINVPVVARRGPAGPGQPPEPEVPAFELFATGGGKRLALGPTAPASANVYVVYSGDARHVLLVRSTKNPSDMRSLAQGHAYGGPRRRTPTWCFRPSTCLRWSRRDQPCG